MKTISCYMKNRAQKNKKELNTHVRLWTYDCDLWTYF